MNKLVVVKDVLLNAKTGGGLISGINEINLLADGALAIFTDKNEMLTASNAAATLVNKKSIYFARGSGSSTLGANLSTPIERESANVEYKYYTSPVKEVILIGNDGVVSGASMNIATPVAGTIAYLRIMDTAEDNINLIRAERYSYTVVTGDLAADVVAGLVAAANANTATKYVVASVNTNQGITITSLEDEQTFEVGLDGIVSAATITTDGSGASVLIAYGSGTSADVSVLESSFNSEDGNTSRLYLANKFYSKPSDVVSGAHYDLANIQWKQTHPTPIKTLPATDQQVIVALPSFPATFLMSTWHTIIAEAFGTAASDAEPGS